MGGECLSLTEAEGMKFQQKESSYKLLPRLRKKKSKEVLVGLHEADTSELKRLTSVVFIGKGYMWFNRRADITRLFYNSV